MIGCRKYDKDDVPVMLDRFFFWKVSALLAETTATKRPQLPESFSEPFVSYLFSLAHNPGTGPDAFELTPEGEVASVVEIKATITDAGFTDIRRDLEFDVLYWLSLGDYSKLRYRIHRLERASLRMVSEQSRTPRERATVGLDKVIRQIGTQPAKKGHIGIVEE